MKYSVPTNECYSPKSPTVIIFPPVPPKPDYLRSQSGVQDFNMPPANDRLSDVENGSVNSVGYQSVRGNGFHGLHKGNIPQSPSTTELLPHPHKSGHKRVPHRPPPLIIPSCRGESFSSGSSTDNASNTSGDSYRRSSTCTRCVNILIAIMFIIFAALFGYLFCTVFTLQTKCDSLQQQLSNVKTSQALTQEEPKLCLPCDELSQGPFVEDNPEFRDLARYDDEGRLICCARSTAQASVLLNLFAKRKQLEKCAQELLLNNRTDAPCNHTCINGAASQPPPRPAFGSISAHLLAGIQPKNPGADPYANQPIRNWLSDRPGTHLKGIQIAEDRLFVPETGLYFLYSQVSFMVFYDGEQDPNAAQSLEHSVYRYNVIYAKGNEELLRSGVTQCWEKQKDYGRYTNYVGASLFLNKGDQLYVKVSKIESLSREETLTYFGIFKMS